MRKIAKSLAAFLTALGTWGVTAGADGTYTQVELWGLTGVAVAGLSTWWVNNDDGINYSGKWTTSDPRP